MLADHYVRVPENGKSILDLIVQLWSLSFASHIFALLFHKWVCELAFCPCIVLLVVKKFCFKDGNMLSKWMLCPHIFHVDKDKSMLEGSSTSPFSHLTSYIYFIVVFGF